MNVPRDSWGDLAEAIILQAADDYRNANKRLREKPDDLELQEIKAEIEEFFLSEWFQQLTDLDGKYLMQRLQTETVQEEDAK